jgi:hypothetical protein
MAIDPERADTERATEEVVARLRSRGIDVSERESTEDLVELLDAVEAFEETVQNRGGDLMVDEPVRSKTPTQPDDLAFVLPTRNPNETIGAYTLRVMQARDRAARVHRPKGG